MRVRGTSVDPARLARLESAEPLPALVPLLEAWERVPCNAVLTCARVVEQRCFSLLACGESAAALALLQPLRAQTERWVQEAEVMVRDVRLSGGDERTLVGLLTRQDRADAAGRKVNARVRALELAHPVATARLWDLTAVVGAAGTVRALRETASRVETGLAVAEGVVKGRWAGIVHGGLGAPRR